MPYDQDFREVENVFLCKACRDSSGQGDFVRIKYTNTGGWSPRWEGRVCEHIATLTRNEFEAKLSNYYGKGETK